MKFILITTALSLLLSSQLLFADPQMIGGDYRIDSIEKTKSGEFLVVFHATHKTGTFDELRLVTDHIHFGVEKGQTLRLSAEVVSAKPKVAEIAQVVLFLPHSQGNVPVWLLSKEHPAHRSDVAPLLEMHAPVNDYLVF